MGFSLLIYVNLCDVFESVFQTQYHPLTHEIKEQKAQPKHIQFVKSLRKVQFCILAISENQCIVILGSFHTLVVLGIQ